MVTKKRHKDDKLKFKVSDLFACVISYECVSTTMKGIRV